MYIVYWLKETVWMDLYKPFTAFFTMFSNWQIFFPYISISCGWDPAEGLERLSANAVVATVLGSISPSSDTVESEVRQTEKEKILTFIKNISYSNMSYLVKTHSEITQKTKSFWVYIFFLNVDATPSSSLLCRVLTMHGRDTNRGPILRQAGPLANELRQKLLRNCTWGKW